MADDEDRAQKQRDGIDREAAKLWRCYRTVHEMVQDRGYLLAEEEVNMSFDTFKSKFTSNDGSVEYAPFSFSPQSTFSQHTLPSISPSGMSYFL